MVAARRMASALQRSAKFARRSTRHMIQVARLVRRRSDAVRRDSPAPGRRDRRMIKFWAGIARIFRKYFRER